MYFSPRSTSIWITEPSGWKVTGWMSIWRPSGFLTTRRVGTFVSWTSFVKPTLHRANSAAARLSNGTIRSRSRWSRVSFLSRASIPHPPSSQTGTPPSSRRRTTCVTVCAGNFIRADALSPLRLCKSVFLGQPERRRVREQLKLFQARLVKLGYPMPTTQASWLRLGRLDRLVPQLPGSHNGMSGISPSLTSPGVLPAAHGDRIAPGRGRRLPAHLPGDGAVVP